MKREVGSNERQCGTLQNVAKIDAETDLLDPKGGRGSSRQCGAGEEEAKVSKVEASKTDTLQVQEANWELHMKQKAAEAIQYQKEEAAAEEALADAKLYTRKQAADAMVYGKKLEAEGLVALADAQGRYLGTLLEALE
ncbi:hypothetical protein MLD38_014092 [Melastoma candidum]|uniref:Uncharacterized protein n=1 Tax=Melastoma candidum TaxID=119954 RepID=A0ACB9RK35_9MYRT|nr:hypothetical protein MLD38_014092 [Melastoma candidum]